MKKTLLLLIIVSIFISIPGCARIRRNNNNMINDQSPGTINDSDTSEIPQGAPLGTTSDSLYLSSVRDVDSTLRNNIRDLENAKIDTNSDDYLVRQGEVYQKRANAYKDALNGINNVTSTANYRNDHNSLVSYYQNGYDTFNSLATKYKGFKTIDDENAYRTGEGRNAYDLMPEVNNAYNKSLTSLGIRYD